MSDRVERLTAKLSDAGMTGLALFVRAMREADKATDQLAKRLRDKK